LEAAGTSPTARGAVLSGGELSSPLRLMPSTNPSLPLHHGQRGDFFVDSTGGLYFCTDDAKPGTPAQWRKIAFEP
jgi:hypothetical protein